MAEIIIIIGKTQSGSSEEMVNNGELYILAIEFTGLNKLQLYILALKMTLDDDRV